MEQLDQDTHISSAFPYPSKYAEILGSKIHYIEQGEGDPIIFLHGIPTWSYIWRNIIPHLSMQGRCIAPDLIGMGRSDKPAIPYRIFDHIHYIEAFIKQLKLKNITFVLHGWGSIIGFHYAMLNENDIKGLAFLEAYLRPVIDWSMISLPIQEMISVLHSPDKGYNVIMNSNYFVNKVLPSGVFRKLSDEEMENYRAPFIEVGSCKPLWQYIQDLPLNDGPADVVELISNYSEALQRSNIPKLMLFAVPGFNTTINTVHWARDHLPNIEIVDIGDGLHYAQETSPTKIGLVLKRWYSSLF